MLLTALQHHSEIHCLDEIFVPRHFQQTYIPEGKSNVSEILDSLSCSPDKQIFGFLVLYNELYHSPYTNGVIDELLHREFRVIHLIRDNLLRRFLSHQVARVTQAWGNTDGHNASTLKIKLSAWDLFVDIKRTLDKTERTRVLFRHLPFLELSYENLCADFTGSFDRVCKFLGVSSQNQTPRTFKQENRSLREAIVNYDRLKLLFTLSKYRRFFED
jgi:LPS sulfotransferase NodH